ncbi:hypothetical protein B4102_3108 [Heyndrickxia sporothermodurans]|uniref:Uncharacterized protein n=1 Tax=Heyndrickxia sporothermodurans TaxID=46224 RepID=A0A150L0U3_9BACI|nr:hypothetical protein B4102_3108 [Heyndrickxia sporothermodurans]
MIDDFLVNTIEVIMNGNLSGLKNGCFCERLLKTTFSKKAKE